MNRIFRPSIETFILIIIVSLITLTIFMISLNESFPGKFIAWQIAHPSDYPDDEETFRNTKKKVFDSYELPPLLIKPAKSQNSSVEQNGREKKVRDPRLGQLRGGRSSCIIYNPDMYIDYTFTNCLRMQVEPYQPYICTHDLNTDIHISFQLQRDSIWEKEMIDRFKDILIAHSDLGVYDIGANIGVYTMVAASMGHKVVAVEPHQPNLYELGKALRKNKLENEVIVLRNAVSNRHGTYELKIPLDNQGGVRLTSQDADKYCDDTTCPKHAENIVLNDLLDVTNFKRAIIKIDIEGHEHKAMRKSSKLFKTVQITHIIMEWQHVRNYYGTHNDENDEKTMVNEMIGTLNSRGFHAEHITTGALLSLKHWYGWPDNVLWVHDNTTNTR
ncbi:hypothetical protein HELRODRAFT_166313 [Helobdella robusta]|uniref:Methyltransferase FkbM domain-containing protein n=1 Tax=Helobdella robusta TaxID=6412 RepID=T1EY05_HELRO|nr:hypothetical protein HELRODRAFT_166313 [Helobdella robusta]ESN90619.1 hypothetical protein HELRODRAFT_166313 [Helobdella robusta]